MKNLLKTICLNYILLLLCPSIALGTDENWWTQYQANAAHTGYVPVTPGLKNVHQLWSTKIEGPSFDGEEASYPIVADGMVFFSRGSRSAGLASSVYAFNEADGKMVWQFPVGRIFSNLSAVSYVGNRIVFEYIHGCSGYPIIFILSSSDGHEYAQIPSNKSFNISFYPLLYNSIWIPNPTVYNNNAFFVHNYNEITLLPGDSLDKKYTLSDYNSGIYDAAISWSPAILNNYLIFYFERGNNSTGDGVLEVFDVNTGSKFDIDNPYAKGDHSFGINLTPIFIDSSHVGVISSGYLTVFDLVNKKISYAVGPDFKSDNFVVDSDTIYAVKDYKVVALNKNSGELLWSWFPQASPSFPNPPSPGSNMIVTNDFLIVQACDVYIISKKTHETVKRINTDDLTFYDDKIPSSCGTFSSIALANKNLYVLKNYQYPGTTHLIAFSLE